MRDRFGRTSFVVVAVLIGGGAFLLAQGRDEHPDARLLGLLTVEIRQLRLAVDELTRSQAQAQALGALVRVQESRVRQLSSRLETAKRDLDVAGEQAKRAASELAAFEAERARVTTATRREQIDEAIQRLMLEQSTVFEREQEGRRHVTDLTRQLEAEESRWSEVIDRLEQLGR